MMNADEQRAYSRGYNAGLRAGKRKRVRTLHHATESRAKAEFLQKAFLATLTAAFAAQGWQQGGKPISTVDDHVALAWRVAKAALLAKPFEAMILPTFEVVDDETPTP
jgi:hypothetical protein